MTGARYVVGGRVQGVGFRWFVLRHAQVLHLKGYARNLPDGRVEVIATGSPDDLAELEAQLRVGPARAAVASLEITPLATEAAPAGGFEIR
ncbi:MAG TPA: acylphosphatase [Gemmatimonadales bacterium]|nr:acylphosphatase [Gemmatimonadales bacterium]